MSHRCFFSRKLTELNELQVGRQQRNRPADHRTSSSCWRKLENLIVGFPLLLAIISVWGVNCQVLAGENSSNSLQRYEFQQVRMGVPWKVIFYAQTDEQANSAQKAVFTRIKQIDRALSDYDPDSELNVLCQQAQPLQFVPVSRDLYVVLQASQSLSRRSNGAFDVTVGHLTDLWRRAYRKNARPDPQRLTEALQKTDYQLIQLHPQQQVRLKQLNMQLDLGGIAKGYAADQALLTFRKHEIDRVLIDASGDIVVGAAPPETTGWKIGIAPMRNPEGDPEMYLQLQHAAVATSGDASRFVEIDGTRYSHLVDPKTGYGLTTPSSVTVIASTGICADGLASALSVMGPEQGFKELLTEQSHAYIVLGTTDGLKTYQTKGFQHYVIEE